MKLYLVRHGQRDFGKNYDKLLPEGIQQSQQLGLYFKDKKIDFVYCSPQNRAKETLDYIKPYLKKKINIKITQSLRQMFIPDEVGEDVIVSYKHRDTPEELEARIRRFMKYLFDNHSNDNVLRVTHKMFIPFLLIDLFGIIPKIKSGSITMLDFDRNGNLKRYEIGKVP